LQRAALPLLLLAGAILAGNPVFAETRLADSVVVSEPLPEDLYALAGEVRIESSVAGAAVLAAGRAEISGDVEGDVILAGGKVDLGGGVGDDLRAAGGDVQVTGFVIDQAAIAGGTVTIGPGSAIGGRTWIAAGNLEMAGQIGDDLRVVAGTVVISGRVAGNVEVAAREIRVEPGAVIGGDLIWRSAQAPVIAEDAEIFGEVRAAGTGGEGYPDEQRDYRATGGWALALTVAVAALILGWFAPGLVARAAGAFRAAPGRTLVLGMAASLLTPVVAVTLFATVLGWILGLVVLAGYVFGLMLSGLVGILIVVQVLRSRLGWPAGAGGWRGVLLVLVVVGGLVLAQLAPWLGGLVSTLLMLVGLGALTAVVTGRAPVAVAPAP
jgi:hypothetical protein